jgi:hypothetical protein
VVTGDDIYALGGGQGIHAVVMRLAREFGTPSRGHNGGESVDMMDPCSSGTHA